MILVASSVASSGVRSMELRLLIVVVTWVIPSSVAVIRWMVAGDGAGVFGVRGLLDGVSSPRSRVARLRQVVPESSWLIISWAFAACWGFGESLVFHTVLARWNVVLDIPWVLPSWSDWRICSEKVLFIWFLIDQSILSCYVTFVKLDWAQKVDAAKATSPKTTRSAKHHHPCSPHPPAQYPTASSYPNPEKRP